MTETRNRNLSRVYSGPPNDTLATPAHQDLGSLGVPFLSVDEDGRSVLNKPLLRETKEDDKPAGVDQPPKPNEDFPDCTTYFYHRWMWIQVNLRLAGHCLRDVAAPSASVLPTAQGMYRHSRCLWCVR